MITSLHHTPSPEGHHPHIEGEGASEQVAVFESVEALGELPSVRELAVKRHRQNRVLLGIAVWLSVAILALGGSLFLYLRSTDTGVPRTDAQRELIVARSLVSASVDDSDAWARYARALAAVGQVDESLQAVDEGIERTGDEMLLLVAADVQRFDRRYADAISTYNSAEARYRAVMAAAPSTKPLGMRGNDFLAQLTYGRGLSEIAVGDSVAGIADLELSTTYVPAAADTWVALGDAYASLGRTSQARDAYEEALRFVPDHVQALQGLDRVGGG